MFGRVSQWRWENSRPEVSFGLFGLSVSSWFNIGRMCVSRNLCISSRFFNCWHKSIHSIFFWFFVSLWFCYFSTFFFFFLFCLFGSSVFSFWWAWLTFCLFLCVSLFKEIMCDFLDSVCFSFVSISFIFSLIFISFFLLTFSFVFLFQKIHLNDVRFFNLRFFLLFEVDLSHCKLSTENCFCCGPWILESCAYTFICQIASWFFI